MGKGHFLFGWGFVVMEEGRRIIAFVAAAVLFGTYCNGGEYDVRVSRIGGGGQLTYAVMSRYPRLDSQSPIAAISKRLDRLQVCINGRRVVMDIASGDYILGLDAIASRNSVALLTGNGVLRVVSGVDRKVTWERVLERRNPIAIGTGNSDTILVLESDGRAYCIDSRNGRDVLSVPIGRMLGGWDVHPKERAIFVPRSYGYERIMWDKDLKVTRKKVAFLGQATAPNIHTIICAAAGERICAVGESGVWIADAADNRARIIDGSRGVLNAALSPRGTLIALVRPITEESGQACVEVRNCDTGQRAIVRTVSVLARVFIPNEESLQVGDEDVQEVRFDSILDTSKPK